MIQNNGFETGNLAYQGIYPNGPIFYLCTDTPYPIPNWHPNNLDSTDSSPDYFFRNSSFYISNFGFQWPYAPNDSWQGDVGEFSSNDRYIQLKEFVGDPMIYGIMSDNIIQSLPAFLTAGDTYVLEYQYAYHQLDAPQSPTFIAPEQFQITHYIDTWGTGCNTLNIGATANEFIPSSNGITTTFNPPATLPESTWTPSITSFQVPSNVTNMGVLVFESGIDLLTQGLGVINSKCQFIDDVCLVDVNDNPINITSTLLNGNAYCPNQPITVQYTVNLSFVGTNTDAIQLQLQLMGDNNPVPVTFIAGPDANAWFDTNGSFTIPQEALNNDGTTQTDLTLFASFSLDNTAILNQNYAVTVDVANGSNTGFLCHAPIDVFQVGQNPFGAFVNVYDGCNTGTLVMLDVACGIPPYTFNWTGPNGFNSTDQNITPPEVGIYTITITDSAGDTVTNSAQVNQLFSALDANITFESCTGMCDGAIDLSPSPNQSVSSFAWTGPDSFSSTQEDIQGLCAGTYNVTVIYNTGCEAAAEFVVSSPLTNYTNPAPITTNTTWSGQNYSIDGDLIVQNNAILTISNQSVISFTPGSRLIVRQGSQLTLNNSTLTSLCNDFWGGVELVGNSSLPQSTTTQGYADVGNNSVISNALVGIRCQGLVNGLEEQSLGGGFVKCSNTHFINNKVDVRIANYFSTQWSYNTNHFSNCTFELNANFFSSDTPSERFQLIGMQQFNIINCVLQNLDPTLLSQQLIGIRSVKASFKMIGTGSTNSMITGFTRGIVSIASSFIPPVVDNTDFFCFRGAYFVGCKPSVTRSNFYAMPNGYPLNPPYIGVSNYPSETGGNAYGLYLDACYVFECQENLFDISDYNTNVGLYVRDSGAFPNQVYRNTFQNLDWGAQFLDRNRNTLIWNQGLQLDCNVFQQNVLDVEINSFNPEHPNAGIGINQGTNNGSASNIFVQAVPSSPQYNDIQNWIYNGQPIYYYFNSNELDPAEVFDLVGDAVNSANIILLLTPFQQTCNSQMEILVDDWQQIKTDANVAYQNSLNDWNMIVDGGNTTALTQDVINTDYSQALELYYNLMSKSPNLSEQVMIEAIQKEYDLPMVLLKEILTSNPQAAKSKAVQTKLDNRLMPLPDYMRQEIQAGMTWVSLKEELEAQMTDAQMRYKGAVSSQIFKLFADTLVLDKTAAIESLLQGEQNLDYTYLLTELYASQKDWAALWTLLDAVPTDFILSPEAATEHADLSYLYGLEQSILGDSLVLASTDLDQLFALMSAGSALTSGKALGLLANYGYFNYTEPEGYPQLPPSMRSMEFSEEREPISLFEVFPNPAHDFIEVSFTEMPLTESATVKVFNVIGDMIVDIPHPIGSRSIIISLDSFENGIYFVALYDMNELIETQKIVKK